MYGKFTVNLGVCVESLFKFRAPYSNKTFYQEYDCQIRTRLGILLHQQDKWWASNNNLNDIIREINTGLSTVGLSWFEGVDRKEKIIENFGTIPYNSSPRAKLDVALLVWFDDKEKGTVLFNEYLNSITKSKPDYKGYVEELAKELGIEIKES